MNKKLSCLIILCSLFFNNPSALALNDVYPCFDRLYLNDDKYEKFNRKIFDMNLKLNRLVVKNIHVLWVSLFPNFVIDILNNVYSNIEYPKRLVSSLIQKDKEAVKNESKRFLINTTLGLGGSFDAAKRFFNLEMYDEDMEQAFAKHNMKCGSYLVLPFVSSATSRDITGRIFDFLLTPTTYIATPVAAAIKLGLLINRTAQIQPAIKTVESDFADSYDIAKKVYGAQKYIKFHNYDRKNVLEKLSGDYDELDLTDNKVEENLSVKAKVENGENLIVNENFSDELNADIFLDGFYPQYPILDSMRTALLDIKGQKGKTFWNEMSVWNRNFSKKIKTAEIEISKNRPKYKIGYVLQKDKKSPLAILFPSVGEGMGNSHGKVLAELFYNEGYSVLILGSHFQWEFLKSVEKGHKPGLIRDDIKYINLLVNNSINYLSKKYDRVFMKRTAAGTSLGAYAVLFLANDQFETGAKNIDKFIAVCPPYELTYAINQMDKIIECWKNYPDDFASKAALTAAKVMRTYKNKDELNKNFKTLPFSNYEAKLISAFVFHQKLSDLVYQVELEQNPNADKKELHNLIYEINFKKYIQKYFANNESYDDIDKVTSIASISNYLISSDNYKIYHSLDDYLTSKKGLKELRGYCDNKLVLFNNGSHLGFLYRDEFIDRLKNEIKIR